MAEDTRAKVAKEAAGKQASARTNDICQELCQHSSGGKYNQKKGYMNVVDEEESPGSAVVVREKGWNHWDRDSAQKPSSSSKQTSPNPSEHKKWCSYHKVKSHDTKECKILFGRFLESGKIEIELPHQKPKNNKSWSKNKKKKLKNLKPEPPKTRNERVPKELS